MDLNVLKDFQLVAAHGGFGKASRASGRSKATLSRHVADLEEALGARLVERGTQRLLLTEAGELLLRRTEGPLAEVADAVAAARDGIRTPRGQLRIAAPILFSQVALGGIVARFLARYPDVEIEAVATDRAVHLVDDRFDVAIRTNPRPDKTLVGRCFARDRLLVAAAPSFPMPIGPMEAPVRLSAVVMPSFKSGTLWEVPSAGFTVAPQPVLRLSSLMAVRDAVVAGAGVGLLPRSIIGHLVAQGLLTSWEYAGNDVELWVLHTGRRHESPKVRAFTDFLAEYYPDGQFSSGLRTIEE